ncbi:diacylglycerol O-acyltransferase 1, partial [Blyttiomyces sp. JEL0837]
FLYHPHGIISLGAFTNFGTEAGGFSKLFPGVDLRLLTLESNFRIPIFPLGICSVSRRSCDTVLQKGPGHSIMIVPGGAAEALYAFPGTLDLVLKRRLGFIKLALRHGAHLVPVIGFGENDLWNQVPNPKGSTLRKLQQTFQKYASFSPPLLYGRGIFLYDYGILPYRKSVVTLVGEPIVCPKISNPTEADLLEYQKLYLDGLKKLYEDNKEKYAVKNKRGLAIVE